ncbi:C40 family peptidase [Actinomadura barringtoniae]|uniref:C40 family peptidase n=1 Tax=Actinomadura barringtoniae TaxID=1427535 RepID=A0A939PB93_9ACTN|nr:C40 family peptidase [Actinomadura barringtoniae]MBO2446853.1 C40 family peptidase [Actinomadura barringtoniae]
MAPDPQKRRFVAPALTVAAIAAVGIGAITIPAAYANPSAPGRAAAAVSTPSPSPSSSSSGSGSGSGKLSESQLRKQLSTLNDEAEKLTEKYNKTRVDLGKAKKAETAATAYATKLEKQATPAREQLGRMAAASYMNGSPAMGFGSGDSNGGLSDDAYLAQNRASVVQGLQGQIDKANRAQQDAQSKAQQAQQAATAAEKARQTAKAKVAEVTKKLDKLTTTTVKDPKSGFKATIKGSGLPAKMARKAATKLGSPYVWAAAGPNSFDCSGLVVWAYAQVGKPGLPHYTGDLMALGTKVDKSDLQAGDLVYFGADLHHMGIYVGGGLFLHAPSTGDVVKISKLSDRSDYAGANRIS